MNTSSVLIRILLLLIAVLEPTVQRKRPPATAGVPPSNNPPNTASNPPNTASNPPNTASNPPDTASNPPNTAPNLPSTASNPPNTASNPPNTASNPPNTASNPPNTASNPPNTASNPPNTASNPPNTASNPPNTASNTPNTASNPPNTASNPPNIASNPPNPASNPPNSASDSLDNTAAGPADTIVDIIAEAAVTTDEEIEARWASPNDAPMPPNGEIPTHRLGNTPYTIYRKSVSWFRAHEHCRMNNQILATFPTEQSYDIVAQLIFDMSVSDPLQKDEFLGARRYWMGLNDFAGEGEYRWIDTGEKLTYMTRFYINQPDHIRKPEDLTHYVHAPGKPDAHCVLLWNPRFEQKYKHVWDDAICSSETGGASFYFICEDFEEKRA